MNECFGDSGNKNGGEEEAVAEMAVAGTAEMVEKESGQVEGILERGFIAFLCRRLTAK